MREGGRERRGEERERKKERERGKENSWCAVGKIRESINISVWWVGISTKILFSLSKSSLYSVVIILYNVKSVVTSILDMFVCWVPSI